MGFKSLFPVLAGVLLTVGVAACGSSADVAERTAEPPTPSASSSKSPPEATASKTAAAEESPGNAGAEPETISIADFQFAGPATVAPGATVMVVNEDRSSHTLTSEAGDFEEVILESGEEGTFTAPTEPGKYAYVCAYHPEMTGTLVVK